VALNAAINLYISSVNIAWVFVKSKIS